MRSSQTALLKKGKPTRIPRQFMPLGRLLTTKSQFRTLCNHLKINLCERGKFYCDINYFIYEIKFFICE